MYAVIYMTYINTYHIYLIYDILAYIFINAKSYIYPGLCCIIIFSLWDFFTVIRKVFSYALFKIQVIKELSIVISFFTIISLLHSLSYHVNLICELGKTLKNTFILQRHMYCISMYFCTVLLSLHFLLSLPISTVSTVLSFAFLPKVFF